MVYVKVCGGVGGICEGVWGVGGICEGVGGWYM